MESINHESDIETGNLLPVSKAANYCRFFLSPWATPCPKDDVGTGEITIPLRKMGS
ncbi:hypothetical protein [Streptomyces laurentii]|uniref:hypothetical protein n=1 Tax=Streptomyces laurentii TaxID=39478 RepID=UPI0033E9BAEC